MFHPRYHGTAFTVLYSNEPVQKTPIKAHLVTSLDSFELISADWRTSFEKFPPGDIERVENKKTAVVLTMHPGSKLMAVTLTTKPLSSDKLAAALTVVPKITPPEISFPGFTEILPTFNFSEPSQSPFLRKAMMNATADLILFFSNTESSTSPNVPLIDAITCLYRVRYSNSKVGPFEASVSDTILSIKRHIVILWCSGIAKCAQPSETALAKVFFARLAFNATQTVKKGAESLSMKCHKLLETTGNYAEKGSPEGVEAAAMEIGQTAEAAANAELSAIGSPDKGYVRLMLNIVTILLSGVIVGTYQSDIDNMAEKTVGFTRAAITKTGFDQAKKELIEVQSLFLKNMLGFLDGLRFEAPFQYIFCVWDLPLPELGEIEFE
jgi:hypothetical protein